MDRAPGPIDLRRLRVRPDERVLVLELELVGLATAELLEVGDPVVRRSGRELVREGERTDRRVAARAPTADQQALAIGFSLGHEVPRSVDAVLEVDHAPLFVEALTVRASVSVDPP